MHILFAIFLAIAALVAVAVWYFKKHSSAAVSAAEAAG